MYLFVWSVLYDCDKFPVYGEGCRVRRCCNSLFDEGISQDKIDEIGDLIRARAEVSNLEFVSADDAWDSFKQTYFEGNEAAGGEFCRG